MFQKRDGAFRILTGQRAFEFPKNQVLLAADGFADFFNPFALNAAQQIVGPDAKQLFRLTFAGPLQKVL
ncbi:hypothetical protein BOO71_0009670 [Deinococcus marmoris]|uniref:Uncharacterized protein n=1 Tax=Deinococcus marmoris TaxID=249408 RepID=A0A1U7NW77_9DEIO|nr:hypothetical protein BOO71_0009670 [Deinococcus marmoris]